jgi:preprotein translocase subunit SecE
MADENKKAVEEADTSKTTKSEKKEKKEKKSKKAKKHFFKDLKGETKKIVWPGRKMVIKSTGIVLLAILVIGAGIWIIDYALSGAIKAFNEAADAEPTTQVETTVPTTAATTEATTEVVITTDAVSTEAESTTNA